jgi:hypothetical protein
MSGTAVAKGPLPPFGHPLQRRGNRAVQFPSPVGREGPIAQQWEGEVPSS